MIRIVTVPLDLTAEADRAIAPAVVLARQLDAALEVVVVSSPGLDHTPDQHELQARATQLVGVATSMTVLESDDAVDALAPYFADPQRLMCMASHGRGRLADAFIPSVTFALVHGTRRPAVVVGPRIDWWPGPVAGIFLGVDERGVPTTTMEVVGAWAADLSCAVHLVQTQSADPTDEVPGAEALGVDAARQWLHEHGVSASVRHVVGEPALTLADMASRSGGSPLVAVTARVETRRERVLRGSVTSRLIAACACPVLVVPAVAVVAETGARADLTIVER
jgi:nucleotide-binding universal stress UspA family protein